MKKSDLVLKLVEMTNLPKKVIEKVIEAKENDKKASYERIANRVSKDLNIELWGNQVRQIRENAKNLLQWEKQALQEINDAIDEKPKYDIENDHYVLYAKNKAKGITEKYSIPVETVDQIFNDFSKHWGNLSGQAIMNKYSLKPKVRNLIKSHIWLYKDSHILSPMSMDNAEKNGTIDEVIQEATYKNFEDKYKHKYKEAHINTLEIEVKKLAKIVGTLDWFIDYITPKLHIIPLQFSKYKKLSSDHTKPVFVFGDKHIGKRDTQWVVRRLDQLSDDIVADNSKEVVLIDLWDHYEALMQWWMHSWQVESMDWKYMWELFMYGIEVYVWFLKKILESGKQIQLKGMWGNHDRMSTKNEWDNERIFSTIFYEMLKMYFKNANIEIEYFSKRLWLFTIDNIDYATNHWEEFGKLKPDALRSKVTTKTNNFLVALFAHYHSASIEQGNNIVKVWIPWLAWENEYDERLLLKSDPWYVKIQKNRHWKPKVEYNFFTS